MSRPSRTGFRALTLGALSLLPLAAQTFPAPQDNLFWFDRRTVRAPYQGTHLIEEAAGEPLRTRHFGQLAHLEDLHLAGGRFHGMRRISAGPQPRLELHASSDGQAWQRVAWAPLPLGPGQARPVALYALEGGHFLFLAGPSPFKDRSGESWFALGRCQPGTDQISFVRILDMGLTSARHPQIPAGAFLPVFAPLTVQLEDGLAFVLPRLGQMWAIQTTPAGAVKIRTRAIFPEVWRHLETGGRVEPVVLGAHPTQDGRVCLATRTRQAALQARQAGESFAPERTPVRVSPGQGGPDTVFAAMEAAAKNRIKEDQKASFKEAADLAVKAFPEVLWWEWDPDSNRLTQIHPPGARTLLRGADDIRRFAFRFLPDGRLVMQ